MPAPVRLLAISSFFPMPLDQGDPMRVVLFLKALSASGELSAWVVERAETTHEDHAELARRIVNMQLTSFSPCGVRPGRRATLARWIGSLASVTPSWVRLRRSTELERQLNVDLSRFDAIFLLGEAAGVYAPAVRRLHSGVHVHWDKSNVLTASSKADAREAPTWQVAIRKKAISFVSKRFEHRVLACVDTVSVTSSDEGVRLERHLGRRPTVIIRSAMPAVSRRPGYNPTARNLLWIGSFSYQPNIDGLMRFVREAETVLQASDLRLKVAGSGRPPEELGNFRTVDVLGFIEDLDELVEGTRAAIVPLWRGAGVKLKTLTLMDLGLPVASTTIGLEGIPRAAALSVSDSASALAQAVSSATPEMLESARQRAFATLSADFSEERFADSVRSLVHHIARERSR
jgi:polysaccharide biosynthesis protein PslH